MSDGIKGRWGQGRSRRRRRMAQNFMDRHVGLRACWRRGFWYVTGGGGEGLTEGIARTLDAAAADYANHLVRRWPWAVVEPVGRVGESD